MSTETLSTKRVGVIGCGVMGQALMLGIRPFVRELWGADKTEKARERVGELLEISVTPGFAESLPGTDVLLLCVKPSGAAAVCDKLRSSGALSPSTLVISIMAGVSIGNLQGRLGPEQPIVRAMPNTPSQVHAGVTVLAAGDRATPEHQTTARAIFGCVGTTIDLDESHMDAVTALSGSGPAFILLVMEALADGGVMVGLPRDVATELVTQVVLGSAFMLRQTGKHPAALRDEVTTPAGCTISGLLTLEDGKIRSVLARAVEEATRVAGGLGR